MMGISIDQYRVSIGLFQKCIFGSKSLFTVYFNLMAIFILIYKLGNFFSRIFYCTHSLLTLIFCNFQSLFIILMALLQAGDIEFNPGPETIHDLSLLHLNIRCIRNKVEYIVDNFLNFQICSSKRHIWMPMFLQIYSLSSTFSTPYRKDRTNHGGGKLAYLNSSL